MKRFIITAWLVLGASSASWAQAVTNSWQNSGVITNPAEIPNAEKTFINQGTITLDLVNVINSTNTSFTALPFSTGYTLNYTNAGIMAAIPGFLFEDRTSGGLAPSANFYNNGTIVGFDFPEYPDVNGSQAIPAYSQPVSAEVEVFATNIVN